MIYTLTLSPCLDYVLEVSNFNKGIINKSKNEYIYPGGKGINVSIVLKELGVKAISLGFSGGITGTMLEEKLKEHNINFDFINTNIDTRINVKISSLEETAINVSNKSPDKKYISKLIKKLQVTLKYFDILVIGGSVPKGFSDTIYQDILESIKDLKVLTIIDTTTSYLINTLKYKPFLIKPNKEEAEEMLNTKINNLDDCFDCAKKLQGLGAKNVIISLDKDGAILLCQNKDKIYIKDACHDIINTVGCGDSLLAGVISKIENSEINLEAFKTGCACGIACAKSIWLPNINDIKSEYKKINNVLKY